MNLQNYLLCILYIVLIITHSFTLYQKDFHRNLISIFSFALFTQTISTVLFTLHQTVITYGHQLTELTDLDFSPIYNIHYIAQLIHVTSINFFILFLLIVAKGWPITRRKMPFKYAFAMFWLLCLAADLVTFYWTTITVLARSLTINYRISMMMMMTPTTTSSSILDTTTIMASTNTSDISSSNSIIESLPKDTEQFNSTPRRLSLLLRIIIMLYFLLELRTTMILEQEQKKLQFYLHFGALSMVWFVHSLIVYVISLRVEIVWQSKLISGFSSAANFLAFAVTTRLLWPKSSRSYLFRKHKRPPPEDATIDTTTPLNDDGECDVTESVQEDEYDGLEMKELGGSGGGGSVGGVRNKYMTNDNINHKNTKDLGNQDNQIELKQKSIPSIRVDIVNRAP